MLKFIKHEVLRKYSIFEKWELVLWAITYVVILIYHIVSALFAEQQGAHIWYSLMVSILVISLSLIPLYVLNFLTIPKIIKGDKPVIYTGISFIVFFIAFFFINEIEVVFFLFVIILIYTALKYSLFYFINKFIINQAGKAFLAPGSIYILIFWTVLMILLIGNEEGPNVITLFSTIIPFSLFIYSLSFHSLLPGSFEKQKPFSSYLLKLIIVIAFTIPAIGLFSWIILSDFNSIGFIILLNIILQVLVTAPLSWIIYSRHLKNVQELQTLKKNYNQSTANLDLLKSQINPHFLFNALNTLYATSIMENMNRTSEGIQKLGDMMRFMLNDNFQDKIPFSRELEYLKNYIELQKLRTEVNPDIKIKVELEETNLQIQIAPMLLIPFVENAFKHGISLIQPSLIKIFLKHNAGHITFEVYNTKHVDKVNSLEKHKSGIGINNVIERLKLLYPQKHELLIKETVKDYFVHLSINTQQ